MTCLDKLSKYSELEEEKSPNVNHYEGKQVLLTQPNIANLYCLARVDRFLT